MNTVNCKEFALWCKETNSKEKEKRIYNVFCKMRDKYSKYKNKFSGRMDWESIYKNKIDYIFEHYYNKEDQ